MGTSLTGTKPKDTYDSLIKVGDNGPISGTAKYLSDGLGNDLPIAVSTSNVGIGTSSPESKLHIADGVSGGIVSLFVDNNINALNSTAQIKFTVDAGGTLTSGGAAIQAVNTDPNYANTDLVFRNSHISSGDLVEVFRLTDGARYLRMASGTGGIQFGGDTAAANALDDYEEGTFTPTFQGTTATGGTVSGNYTKIGRVVYVNIRVDGVTFLGSSGAAIIDGLPFTVASGFVYSNFSTNYQNCVDGSSTGGFFIVGSTILRFHDLANITAATYIDGVGRELILSGCYFV